MSTLKVGLVGYCPPTKFDSVRAKELVEQALDRVQRDHPAVNQFVLVSGLANVGIPAIGYAIAQGRPNWETMGIACEEVNGFEWFPVSIEPPIIVGRDWGDESQRFLQECDGGVLVRVGGGTQSHEEAGQFARNGGTVYAYELPVLDS